MSRHGRVIHVKKTYHRRSLVQVAVDVVKRAFAGSVTLSPSSSIAAQAWRLRPATRRPAEATSPTSEFLSNGGFGVLCSWSCYVRQQVID